MFARNSAKKSASINLTPLVDIIFQLVIFFMLSTSFVKLQALDLFIGEGKESANIAPQNLTYAQKTIRQNSAPILISLTEEGVFIGTEEFNHKSLKSRITKVLEQNPRREVKILSHKGASVQSLVDVVDLVKNAGAVGLVVDRNEE